MSQIQNFKLSDIDQAKFDKLKYAFQKFKAFIKEGIDKLEIQIFTMMDTLWQTQPFFNQMQQVEQFVELQMKASTFDINSLIPKLDKVLVIQKSGQIQKFDKIQSYFSLENAIQQLSVGKSNLQAAFSQVSKCLLDQTKQQDKDLEGLQCVWKYKQKALDKGEGIPVQKFAQGYIYVETILPTKHVMLTAIYQAELFKGKSMHYGLTDSQQLGATLTFRVHEGYDMSSIMFEQSFVIQHDKMLADSVNGCYHLQLAQEVLLKKGVVYSLSMTNETNKEVYTFVHSNKTVAHSAIKFMGKETEQMNFHCPFGTIRQSLIHSSMPGLQIKLAY